MLNATLYYDEMLIATCMRSLPRFKDFAPAAGHVRHIRQSARLHSFLYLCFCSYVRLKLCADTGRMINYVLHCLGHLYEELNKR